METSHNQNQNWEHLWLLLSLLAAKIDTVDASVDAFYAEVGISPRKKEKLIDSHICTHDGFSKTKVVDVWNGGREVTLYPHHKTHTSHED